MTKIGTGETLSLEYRPYNEKGSTKGALLPGSIRNALNADSNDAAFIKLTLENYDEKDAAISLRVLETTEFAGRGIEELGNIVTKQQELAARLIEGVSEETKTAIEREFNALLDEYNNIYNSLFGMFPEGNVRFSSGGQFDASVDLSKLLYNVVSVSTSSKTVSGGSVTPGGSISEQINHSDKAIENVEGGEVEPFEPFIVYADQGNPTGATYNLQGGEVQAYDDGTTISYTLDFNVSYGSNTRDIMFQSDGYSFNNISFNFAAFNTGDKIIAQGTNLDQTTEYYFIKDSDTQGRLAASYSDAMAGIHVNIGTPTVLAQITKYGTESNFSSRFDTLTIYGHALTTGTAVSFDPAQGIDLPDGLNENDLYYVIAVDPNNIKFATSYSNAMSGIAVDLTSLGSTSWGTQQGKLNIIDTWGTPFNENLNILYIDGHGLQTGDEIELHTLGSLPEGLDYESLYVIRINDDSIQLALSYADAMSGNEINFEGVVFNPYDGYDDFVILNRTAGGAFNPLNNSIRIEGHSLSIGDKVRISGDDLPDGMFSWQDYYVADISGDHIWLATDSGLTEWADFTSSGSGAIDITQILPVDSDIDTDLDTVTIEDHGIRTGATVRLSSDGTLPSGVNAFSTYYAIAIDEDTIRFATTRKKALEGDYLDLSTLGTGTLSVEVLDNSYHADLGTLTSFESIDGITDTFTLSGHGYSTGDTVRLTGDNLPAEFSEGIDYYVIAQDANTFQLASSHANALLGNEINFSYSTGSFAAATSTVEVADGRVNTVALGDFNADGIQDMVTGGYEMGYSGILGFVNIKFGNGDGTFSGSTSVSFFGTSEVKDITVADIDGDGKDDIVTSGTIVGFGGATGVLLNNGDGTFAAMTSYVDYASASSSSVLGDLNGDGILDLVTAGTYTGSSGNGGIATVRLGQGDGTFGASTSYMADVYDTLAVTLGDLNGDGNLDLVSTGSNTATIRLGNGDGTFGASTSFTTGGGSFSSYDVKLADLDGDSNLDLITGGTTGSGYVTVHMGQGDGTFDTGKSIWTSSSGVVRGIEIVDVNNDSILDILGADRKDGVVLFGQGEGNFSTPTTITVGSPLLTDIAVGDLNGDGSLDVLMGGVYDGGFTAISLGNFQSGPFFIAPSNSAINIDNNTLTLNSHGFATGTKITVSSTGSLPNGLTDDTEYYVIADDANTIRFATSLANAISGTAIDLISAGHGIISLLEVGGGEESAFDSENDEVTIEAHGLSNGQRIQFNGTGTAPAGLSKDTDYYAIVSGDPDVFKVAASYQDALDGIAIDFTDNGEGELNLRTFETISPFDDATNTITKEAHGYATGQRIQFKPADGTLASGLEYATDYYVIATGADTFQVAASYADALAGNEIDFGSGASGSVSIASLGTSNFDSDSDSLTIAGHGYSTGDKVTLSASISGLPEGLSAREYYVIVEDGNTIKFALTAEDAANGIAVDITGGGSGSIDLVTYSETTTPSSGTQGSYDLSSSNGLLSTKATLANLSNALGGLRSESSSINSRLKGIAAYLR